MQTALTAETQQNEAHKEAGAYERKSVSFINALWLMDRSVREMPQEYVGIILDEVKRNIEMERFDYNPLPDTLIREFVLQANAIDFDQLGGPQKKELIPGQPDIMMDSITAVLERTLVPRIVSIVNAQKEMRAQGLLTEQQKNSFITDKAKELGITDAELKKVMNSAFVFIPLARRYLSITNLEDSSFVMTMEVGILWWQIKSAGDSTYAVPRVKKFTYSMGRSMVGRKYPTQDGLVDFHEFAFRTLVKNAARNMKVATQEMDEFRLSAQILETGAFKVTFNLGKKEGLRVDDKYRIIKAVEGEQGKVDKKNAGWIRVTGVGAKSGENKSRGAIVSGRPILGSELREYPRLPLDIILTGRMFPYAVDSTNKRGTYFDSLSLEGFLGGEIHAAYNIGRFIQVPQLFFDFGYGIGAGSGSGSLYPAINGKPDTQHKTSVDYVFNMCFDFSLVKKFYIRRFAIVLQPVFSIQRLYLYAKDYTVKNPDTTFNSRWINTGLGGAAIGGIEIALSPALNFGISGGYQIFPSSTDWGFERKKSTENKWQKSGTLDMSKDAGVDYSGPVIKISFTYSPPSLPFDPLDWIRGRMGVKEK